MQTSLSRCVIWVILLALIAGVSGCVTTFTPSGQLQVGLSASANDNAQVLADFEASEETAFAGDVTKKSGSSCAGGVCTIY